MGCEAVRSGRGFGDSLYLQSVARHLTATGKRIEVCTNYPDIFLPLNGRVTVSPFRRERISRVAHYISRKHIAGTDQFLDCCISAGIKEPVELKLDWVPRNAALVDWIKGAGKPIVLVQLPRLPMDRVDGYGADLLPDCRTIQRAIHLLKSRAYIVQVGQGEALFEFDGIDLDLANKTTVSDVLDVAFAADGVLGYCSFIVPLAESLSKLALLVWSRRGLQSSNAFIRAITPPKIMHRQSSRVVMDDCSQAELIEAVDEFGKTLSNGSMT